MADLVDRCYWQVLARRGDAGPDVVGFRSWLIEALTEFEVRMLSSAVSCQVPDWHPDNLEGGL